MNCSVFKKETQVVVHNIEIKCTVCVFRPDHFWQNVQWIWSSALTEINWDNDCRMCMGYEHGIAVCHPPSHIAAATKTMLFLVVLLLTCYPEVRSENMAYS